MELKEARGGAREGGRKRRRWHPTPEEVVDRLRDDGDFDSLRLSLIRKLKHNEELRNSIIEEVKQSLVLKDETSESMKIREISDVLYQELGGKIMGKISDSVWQTITSSEGEIQESIELVYNRILYPDTEKKRETSDCALENGRNCNNQENEPDEPPGFALPVKNNETENINNNEENDGAPPGFGSDGDDNGVASDVDAPPPGFC